MTASFAVFGNPIAQSKSPQIHAQFAQQFDLSIDYQRKLSTPEQFGTDLRAFFAQSGTGCNVTAPFKEQAFTQCDTVSASANRAKAVNTVYKDAENRLCGHNSDGTGLVNDLLINQNIELKDRNVIVLGAGGATRGILGPIIAEQPNSLIIANRTEQKAEQLAREFADLFPIQSTSTEKPLFAETPDLLINATSASLSSNLPVSDTRLIDAHTDCYDLTYKNEPTAFLQWAAAQGANKTIDGKGMLAEQAAISFQMWTNLQPDTTDVITWLANN